MEALVGFECKTPLATSDAKNLAQIVWRLGKHVECPSFLVSRCFWAPGLRSL